MNWKEFVLKIWWSISVNIGTGQLELYPDGSRDIYGEQWCQSTPN